MEEARLPTLIEVFERLGLALAVGLLIGAERGWQGRGREEGGRVAGLRTFALIGLLGGVAALTGDFSSPWLVLMGLIGVAALLVSGYVVSLSHSGDLGITTAVAALITYVLGALAGYGASTIAAATAVVVVIVLGAKPVLHAWVEKLQRTELEAAMKLLLISVVVLPVLPNEGFGPWQALNPYKIWWMVVLVASVSFAGYFLVRIAGAERGIYLTGLAGGLVASTAVTLNLSRLARDRAMSLDLLASGVLAACATMFPRMLVVTGVIEPDLAVALLAPVVVAGAIAYGAAWWCARRVQDLDPGTPLTLGRPFDFSVALRFGLLLAVILLAARGLSETLGATGVLFLAAFGGLADVDPISLSFADMAGTQIDVDTAVTGLLIAATSNSLVKIALATAIGGRAFGLRIGAGLGLALLGGGMVAFLR